MRTEADRSEGRDVLRGWSLAGMNELTWRQIAMSVSSCTGTTRTPFMKRSACRGAGSASRRSLSSAHQLDNILRLTHADRPMERAVAAGSIPPEMRHLQTGPKATRRGEALRSRQPGPERAGYPDRVFQLRMREDALDYRGDPGIAALLTTGDGAGYLGPCTLATGLTPRQPAPFAVSRLGQRVR